MTEIYLVRHPQSVLNTDRSLIGGRTNNIPITQLGAEQARRFAKAFSAQYPSPTVFYSSPAVRTKALMDIYNETTGQFNDYLIDDSLQEMSQGEGEGQPRAEVYTPEVLQRIEEMQFDFALPGGETLNEVSDRMLNWVYEADTHHPDSVILVATHGQAIRAVAGKLLGWSRFETTIDPLHWTDNVSVTHLTVQDGVATVNFWNKTIIEPVENNESKLY